MLFEGASRPNESKGHAGGIVPGTSAMRMMGRSERNEIVHVDVPRGRDGYGLVGRFVDVRVASANAHSLVGALDESDARGLPELAAVPARESPVRLSVLSGP